MLTAAKPYCKSLKC